MTWPPQLVVPMHLLRRNSFLLSTAGQVAPFWVFNCPQDGWMLCLFVTFLARTLQHSSIKFYLSGSQINRPYVASELSTSIRGSWTHLQTVSARRGSYVASSIARALLPPHGCLLHMILMLIIWQSLDLGQIT